MYTLELPSTINLITSLFYRLGFWHRGEKPTVKEIKLKIFYSMYHLLFTSSTLAGAIFSDNKEEAIFSLECGISIAIVSIKLLFIIWKQNQILELLNRICVYSIDKHEEFTFVNDESKYFMKLVFILLIPSSLAALCAVFVVPFLGSEKKLFFNIAFPLDWKNNEMAYWIAFAFILTSIILSLIAVLFSPLLWYLMMSCNMKYKVLGIQIRKMGEIKTTVTTGKQRQISKMEKNNKFLADLINAFKFSNRIREEIQQMESVLSPFFIAQLATSGLCICGSIYCLVFSNNRHFIENFIFLALLFYNIFEIFMVMYFGNEIMSSSDRLSYCAFESDWADQPQSTKKSLIIFSEIVKQPYVLFVCKIYPLTLETFTRILNSAYSMFNILKNLK